MELTLKNILAATLLILLPNFTASGMDQFPSMFNDTPAKHRDFFYALSKGDMWGIDVGMVTILSHNRLRELTQPIPFWHIVIYNGFINIIPHLLRFIPTSSRAKFIMARHPDGKTALHIAALGKASDDIIRSTLIAYLFDKIPLQEDIFRFVTASDVDGNTALHFAAMNNLVNVIQVLISAISPERRAQFINLTNNENKTAFDYAPPKAKKLLRHKGCLIL